MLLLDVYSQSSSSATFTAGGSSVGRPAIWISSLMTSSLVILLSMAKKASSRAWKQQAKRCVSKSQATPCNAGFKIEEIQVVSLIRKCFQCPSTVEQRKRL